jgi:hypothetical protein
MEESIVYRLFVYILVAYIFFSVAAICKLRKLRKTKEEVARRITPTDYDLWSTLIWAQHKYGLPLQYCLDKVADRTIVTDIVNDYKLRLSASYFEDRLHPNSIKEGQTESDCFLLSLYDYLGRTKIHDIPGHQEEKFELIYFKVYYIAYLHCKNSPISNPSLFPNWEDYVEKYLISELDERTS